MVTRLYLNLLGFFSCFLEKYKPLCILKGNMPFKMHKIISFPEKKCKNMCVTTLPKIFRPLTRNTYFFIWPYNNHFHSDGFIYVPEDCYTCP